jgi:hypothetical protein
VSEPTASFPSRIRGATIAAALLAVWGAVENFQLESASTLRDPYMVGVQADRFAGVMQAVPRDAIVGYISDLHDNSTGAQAMFNSARYTLAPRLLVEGTDRDFVVGNFTKPMDYAAFGREHGLQFVQDFGNGAVLYRKAAK